MCVLWVEPCCALCACILHSGLCVVSGMFCCVIRLATASRVLMVGYVCVCMYTCALVTLGKHSLLQPACNIGVCKKIPMPQLHGTRDKVNLRQQYT